MYTYYCKDSNCQGHTKSWERCCDMRAFSTNGTTKTNPFQMSNPRTPYYPLKKQAVA